MTTNGLEVFDKTVQLTNLWLKDIMADIKPDRQVAWHALGTVLRTVRDRIPVGMAAHLGAQLPLLIRGAYYEHWQPLSEPKTYRTQEEFLAEISAGLYGVSDVVGPEAAARAVFGAINHYVEPGQVQNVRDALPEDIRRLWPVGAGGMSSAA